MKRTFFIKNALLLVIPLLVPVAILGALSIFITQQYEKSEIAKNNLLLFSQMDRTLEQVFSEMESLYVSLGNSEALYRLEETLQARSIALDDYRTMKMVQNYLNAPATVKPYMKSVYVYVENPHGHFLVDGSGLVRLDSFFDTAWLGSYETHKEKRQVWSESRQLQDYSFTAPFPVTTLYKNLISTIQDRPIGVIVINVDTSYMEAWFDSMALYAGQRILVADEQGRIVFRSRSGAKQADTAGPVKKEQTLNEALESIGVGADPSRWKQWGYSGIAVAQSESSAVKGWSYVSLTPQRAFGEIPFKLSYMTTSLILLSLALSLVLSYLLSRRSTRQVRSIITLLQHAEQGKLPTAAVSGKGDPYSIITEKIIKNFIEQHYLNVQLSEKKYRLQSAQLLALQAQINPHFLHNTLQTVYWKVLGLTGQPNEASRMMENLSGLLKYSLEKPQETVPIEREISNAKHYLDIQKIRYRDKITVKWQYDEEEIAGTSTIKLLLQPVIENAIHHGLLPDRAIHLKIKLWRRPDALRIVVTDNGSGISPERLREIRKQIREQDDSYSHIGLVNTSKRMMLSYGEEEGLVIRSKPNWGTSVSLTVPQRPASGTEPA